MGRQASEIPYILLTTDGFGAEAHRLTRAAKYSQGRNPSQLRLPAGQIKVK
jgi:hypothetical protein